MKTKKRLTLISAIFLICVLICSAFFSLAGNFGFKESDVVQNDPVVSEYAAALDTKYGAFPNGSGYYYTDVNSIEGFRAKTLASDVKRQIVDENQPHGSIANPFVIRTVEQWNAFASDTKATVSTNYFCLGADLDFSGKTFKSVPSLGAKFFGNAYYISNVTHNFGSTANCGIFGVATDTAIIADLNVDNFNYNNLTGNTGGIVGHAKGSVLNCHTRGSISGTINVVYQSPGCIGGVVGKVSLNTDVVYIYRCSTFIDITVSSSAAAPVAGLLGRTGEGAGLRLYDCFSICNAKISGSDSSWFGGVFTFDAIGYENRGQEVLNQKIENIVGYTNIIDNASRRHSQGALFNGWSDMNSYVSFDINNTYTAGTTRVGGGSAYDIQNTLFYDTQTGYVKSATGSNIHWYGQNIYAPTASVDIMANKGVATDRWNGSSGRTRSDMYAAAVTDSILSPDIWVNKAIIDDTYMTNTDVTSTTGYTIDNSPVRNPLFVKVKYMNYKNGADEPIVFPGLALEDDWHVIDSSHNLVDPLTYSGYIAPANHVFKGWTLDKTGKGSVFTDKKGLRGENKLYAVWGVGNNTVTDKIDVTITGAGTEDASGNVTITALDDSVKLQSKIEVDDMNDPVWTVKWKQNGTENNLTTNDISLSHVKEDGTYTFDYEFHSKSEPLWSGKGTSTSSRKVTVNPAPLTLSSFSIKDGEIPYKGRHYDGETGVPPVKPYAVVVDNGGNLIEGTSDWKVTIGEIGLPENMTGENETKRFVFTPDAMYDGDYGTNVEFDGTFKVEYLKLTFNIPQLSLKESIDIAYGQNHSYFNVARYFTTMFTPLYPTYASMLNGYSPAFPVQGQINPVNIDQYKNWTNNDGSTEAYRDVRDSFTIDVTFVNVKYTVRYLQNDGTGAVINTLTDQNYGKLLVKPANPTWGTKMFLGWIYDSYDDNGNLIGTSRWDFDNDVVTGDLDLRAHWLEADTLEDLKVRAKKAAYEARTAITNADLEVEAVFSGTDVDGQKITQSVILSLGDYSVTYLYNGRDNLLHVNPAGTTDIKVSYSFAGSTVQTLDKTISLTVNPISVNVSDLNFNDVTVVEDGQVHTITVSRVALQGHASELQQTVTYKYYDASQNELPTIGASAIGTYMVEAVLTPLNADYSVVNPTAYLIIVPPAILLDVQWDKTTFDYNGNVQHPVPKFFMHDDPTEEVTLAEGTGYHFTGDETSTTVGNYTLTVVIDDANYAVFGIGAVSYTINKAILETPSIKGGDIYYTGNIIDLVAEDKLNNFNPLIMTTTDTSGDIAKRYTAYFELTDMTNCEWKDAPGSSTVSLNWEIKKKSITVQWDEYEFIKDGSNVQHPVVKGFIGILAADLAQIDWDNDFLYVGDVDKYEEGSYTISLTINGAPAWYTNYELVLPNDYDYVIVPRPGMSIITVEWENTELVFNNRVQAPTYKVLDKDGNDITANVSSLLELGGDVNKSRYVNTYTAEIKLKNANTPYFIRSGQACTYYIIYDEFGNGDDPNPGGNDPENPEEPGNNGGGFSLPENFPLWQIAVMAVSLIMFIIFAAKSASYSSKAKQAKKDAANVGMRTFAGFLPIFSGTKVLFGLSNSVWSIMAFGCVGIMLISLIAMCVNHGKCKKAEAAKEQAIIGEQKLREEERERKDNEFKMMIMGMMNNGGANGGAGAGYSPAEFENAIARAVTAVLPTAMPNLLLQGAVADDGVKEMLEHHERILEELLERTGGNTETVVTYAEPDDDDETDDEWGIDDDDDELEEEVVVDENGEVVKRGPRPNFRTRMKAFDPINREFYEAIKNRFNSGKNVASRVCGRVEKIKYHGELIAAIGVNKKSLKLWLALDPNEFDPERYFQKDVSDKPRFAEVPLQVKVGSNRAVDRAFELIDALFEKFGVETRKRYKDKGIQELLFTLRNNVLLKNPELKPLLRENVTLAASKALEDETAESCIEHKPVEMQFDEEVYGTVTTEEIDGEFTDGQRVTLEHLKKKGLIGEECNGYMVSAAGRLTKPLCVIANGFSLEAVKMIVLTGGRAITLDKQEFYE